MKGIRRSLNKDKIGAPTPTYSTVSTASYPSVASQQRPASANRPTAAPAPPKRVIRAITEYKAQGNQELSFSEGDFFHVVSDDGGEDWFDAANPMTGARGLVPAHCFQVLGRNVRETAQGVAGRNGGGGLGGGATSPGYNPGTSFQQQQHQQQAAYPQQPHLSSQQQTQPRQHIPASGPMQSTFAPAPLGSPTLAGTTSISSPATSNGTGTRSRPQSNPKSQPLYGIVQYDFVAERADELDAKRGEPIIVIAQSNHEWFVAKPIGRLGGPGLIPVAFVEIQDMTTGKPVENVEELIRSAVVPKVEEWKKMTADYKSASIPLGRFDFADSAPPAGSAGSRNTASTLASPTSGQSHPSYQQQQSFNRHPDHSSSSDAQDGPLFSPTTSDNASRHSGPGYEENNRYSMERQRYGLVTAASVESFHQEEGSFWFHVRAHFSSGASFVLYRLYQDFYEFQITLMEDFPVEAGRLPPGGEGSGRPVERILPMMPGPTDFEDEVVCAQRVQDLSIYLADLCALPNRIREAPVMFSFFVLRAGDVEVEKPDPGRTPSIDGQYGELVDYLDKMEGPRDVPDIGSLSLNGGQGHHPQSREQEEYRPYGGAQQQYQQQQGRMSAGGFSDDRGSTPRSAEDQYGSRSHQPQQSYQATYGSSAGPVAPQSHGNANQTVPFVKIKIFHRNTDDLIAIRVPPDVRHAQLLEKVRERLGNDVVNLRYREEVGSGSGPSGGGQAIMAGGARLIGLDSDADLHQWIRGGSRLVLYAD